MDQFAVVVHWLHAHDIDTVLAVLAIIFATIQFIDSRRQEHHMKALAKSMSTRFIGQFPLNMPEILDVVTRTDQNLDILVDVAAYGHYSRPAIFASYQKTIENRRKSGCVARMIVHDQAIFRRYREEQFPKADFHREKTSERFNNFFLANPRLDRPEIWEDFQAILDSEQSAYLKVFQRAGVQVRSIANPSFISLWLEDREDAVFSFQNPKEHEREVSFRTRDGNLIDVLHGQFERAWNASIALPLPPP